MVKSVNRPLRCVQPLFVGQSCREADIVNIYVLEMGIRLVHGLLQVNLCQMLFDVSVVLVTFTVLKPSFLSHSDYNQS